MRQSHMAAAGVTAIADKPVTGTPDQLESAIETLANGTIGYRSLAAEVDSATLSSLFLTFADERKTTLEAVMRAATDSGVDFEADTDGTLAAAAHRAWLKLEAMIKGDAATVESVEEAEDRAITMLEDALNDELPKPLAAAIRSAIHDVASTKSRLSDWRIQLNS